MPESIEVAVPEISAPPAAPITVAATVIGGEVIFPDAEAEESHARQVLRDGLSGCIGELLGAGDGVLTLELIGQYHTPTVPSEEATRLRRDLRKTLPPLLVTGGESVLFAPPSETHVNNYGRVQVVGRWERVDPLALTLEEVSCSAAAFRQGVVARLQPVLDAYLQKQNPQTVQEKRQIADYLMWYLDRLGLLISCKGRLCRLAADTGGRSGEVGRFVLTPVGSSASILTGKPLASILPLVLADAAGPATPPPLPAVTS